MKGSWPLTAAFGCTVAIAPCGADGHMAEAHGVQVIHPWAEASSTERTKGYPTIANDNGHVIVLVGVTTPVAEVVAILQHGAVIDRLEIEPGDIADPETMHLEFIGLDEPLQQGHDFKATFHFAEGAPIEIEFVVGEMTMMPAAMKH